MEKKLEVNNLTISFRTQGGKLQAVRGINFDLYKGETLALVGESGSGKSVTNKAILGILAGNSIVEGGEIIYDGQDLLKISEEDFHAIRGDKIAMIFQDPLSSLNPIMRIGKQLTEAMLLKGKARQKESRKNFNEKLALLQKNIIEAVAKNDDVKAKEISLKVKNFDKFEYKHLELEGEYNEAFQAVTESIEEIKNILFEIEKNAVPAKAINGRINIILATAKKVVSRYVVHEKATEYNALIASVLAESKIIKNTNDFKKLTQDLASMLAILEEAVTFVQPNFFAMGYYLTFANEALPEKPVAELNVFLRKYLDENFMFDFRALAEEGIKHSFYSSLEKKKAVNALIAKLLPVFEAENLDQKAVASACKELVEGVNGAINRLAIKKDSVEYTFELAIQSAINKYFKAIITNQKELKKHAKMQAKYDALVAKGKNPDWKVTPPAVLDLALLQNNIVSIIKRLAKHYENVFATTESVDFEAITVDMIDYLKEKAAGVVNKVTKSMAKHRALKLMEEVGIPEPRKRYTQYPFEFSGGMRQRIVIAIALAADPDILICDEPTTALDVTIQAQILELINKLKVERQLSVIFITHDLGVVANMADRIAVMYAGKIVEYGTSEEVFYSPAHPYTWALLASMPDLDTNEKLEAIPGTPPNMIYPPKGDAFADRNKYALEIDYEMQPPMFQITETHSAATWLLHPDAPKVNPPKIVTERIERMKNKGGSSDG